MSYTSGLITGVVGTVLVAGGAGAGWWMLGAKTGESAKSTPPAIPATVSKNFKEDQAATVTLEPDAEAKLPVQLGKVQRKPMRRSRVYGGEVLIPPGHAVVVSAPLAGVLKPAPGVHLSAGSIVRRGDPVFQLSPLLDPVGRANLAASKVDAEGLVKNAEEQLKAAQLALDTANGMVKGGTGTKRMVEDAEARVAIAAEALKAAKARSALMDSILGEVAKGTTTPLPVEAPADGIVRAVSALPGQTVPAGAILFEVVNVDVVWVRVGVYAGDLSEIDPREATVGSLAASSGFAGRPATPVSAPPTLAPQAGTADLFYEIANPPAALAGLVGFGFVGCDGPRLAPGQRVAVTVPLNDPAENLTVPWSAVLYDFHGGTWVYVKVAPRTYSRQRVVVRYVKDDTAILDAGPAADKDVVIVGAAELFGTEAGFSK